MGRDEGNRFCIFNFCSPPNSFEINRNRSRSKATSMANHLTPESAGKKSNSPGIPPSNDPLATHYNVIMKQWERPTEHLVDSSQGANTFPGASSRSESQSTSKPGFIAKLFGKVRPLNSCLRCSH